MSFPAKSVDCLQNQLSVQELCLSTADIAILKADSSDYIVVVGEPVKRVRCAIKSATAGGAGSVTAVAGSSITIVDSASPYGAGGDQSAIRLAGLTLAAGDQIIVKYEV